MDQLTTLDWTQLGDSASSCRYGWTWFIPLILAEGAAGALFSWKWLIYKEGKNKSNATSSLGLELAHYDYSDVQLSNVRYKTGAGPF